MDNGWKKIFFGEDMPDKEDPRYKKRYEREVAAGHKFADRIGLSWLAGQLQLYGQNHKKAFLTFTFGFVLALFVLNVTRLARAYRAGASKVSPTVVSRMDSALHNIHHNNLKSEQ